MNPIIIVLTDQNFSLKHSRIILTSLGILMIIWGIAMAFSSEEKLFGSYFVFYGLFYLFMSGLVLSKHSRLSRKVKITNDSLQLKNEIFKKPIEVKWSDIKSIALGSYRLIIHTPSEVLKLNYSCRIEISKEVKHSVREVAIEKGIPVTEG